MTIIGKASLALVLGFGLLAAHPSSAQEPQSDSLQITLVQVQAVAGHPRFRVKLHNAGDRALILNLGMMLANGKKQYADAIHLLLTDAHGKTLPLELTGPAYVAGRIDPFVVPLPEGATLTLPIDLEDYSSPRQHIFKLSFAPGQYTLSAEYTGAGVSQQTANLDMKGISLMPYWIGTVKSNVLPFTITQSTGMLHER
jgi:hypothetical protein